MSVHASPGARLAGIAKQPSGRQGVKTLPAGDKSSKKTLGCQHTVKVGLAWGLLPLRLKLPEAAGSLTPICQAISWGYASKQPTAKRCIASGIQPKKRWRPVLKKSPLYFFREILLPSGGLPFSHFIERAFSDQGRGAVVITLLRSKCGFASCVFSFLLKN